jgi:putative methionine-R-sulfoxide reductase with GAF domain
MGLPLDGPGINIKVINTRKTWNVPDTRADPDYITTLIGEEGQTLSQLSVPVLSFGKAIGVVTVEHLELNAFDETDQKLLEAITENAGYSLSRIRYGERLKELHLLASKLSSSKSISETAEYSLEAMVNILDLASCEFLLVQDSFPQSILRKGLDETIQIREKVIEVSSFSERLREASKLDFQSTLEVLVEVDNEFVAILRAQSIREDAYTKQDKELLETLASHVASTIQRIRNKVEMIELAYRLNNLEPGGCYLSASHERCLKAYAVLSMEGVPGLCIVRDDPQRLVDIYGIKKDDIKLLSSRSFEGYETLRDLQSVSLALNRFLESGKGVVLLDGLEYLISRFGFDAVYSFIQEKRFDFLRSKAVLLVPIEMRTLDDRQQALLSSEFTLLE